MGRIFLSGQTTCALLLGAGLLLRAQAALRVNEPAGVEQRTSLAREPRQADAADEPEAPSRYQRPPEAPRPAPRVVKIREARPHVPASQPRAAQSHTSRKHNHLAARTARPTRAAAPVSARARLVAPRTVKTPSAAGAWAGQLVSQSRKRGAHRPAAAQEGRCEDTSAPTGARSNGQSGG